MSTRTFDYRGRRYRIVAMFTGDVRAELARDYIRTHTHVRLLCDEGGEAVVVADRDFGISLDDVDSGFDTKGWTGILLPKPGGE